MSVEKIAERLNDRFESFLARNAPPIPPLFLAMQP